MTSPENGCSYSLYISNFISPQAEVAAKRAELKRREAGSAVTSGSGPLPPPPPLNMPVYR